MKGMASIVVPQDIPTGDGYVVAGKYQYFINVVCPHVFQK